MLKQHQTHRPLQGKSYRSIGKTGLKMSDISFGAGKLSAASMVLRAVDSGINYLILPLITASLKRPGRGYGQVKKGQSHHHVEILQPYAVSRSSPLGTKKRITSHLSKGASLE